jgi:hypothetical protein
MADPLKIQSALDTEVGGPSMSKPKFAVGEVVILQSVNRPEFNGEQTVLVVAEHGQVYRSPHTGKRIRNASGERAYILDLPATDSTGGPVQWSERALRKRHQPGEYSWQDLKTILNLPVSRTELARLDREVASHG